MKHSPTIFHASPLSRAGAPHLLLLGLLLVSLLWLPSAPAQAQEEEIGNVDIILVIDTSGSMAANDPEGLRVSAAKLFVDLASEGDRFGIVTLAGDESTVALTPELVTIDGPDSREALKEIIEQARETRGSTFMGKALNIAFDLLAQSQPNPQRFVLLLTDGDPDPASQEEVVIEAMGKFQLQPNWPVFAIALGNDARIDYLTENVTTPGSGQTYQAQTASELVDLYLQLYELLLDDRYIETLFIRPGELVDVASLIPEHQMNQISFVLHRQESAQSITRLLNGRGDDLTLPQPEIPSYVGDDIAYEVYTIFALGTRDLSGEWQMRIDGNNEARVTVMARSGLRTRWLSPQPSNYFDERSVRYVPADRPSLFQFGALDRTENLLPGMTPALQFPYEFESENGPLIQLEDNGQGWDFLPGDGYYTAVNPDPLPIGRYALQVEVPRLNEQPVRLQKVYGVEVLPLPGMEILFTQSASNFGFGDAITGEIRLASIPGVGVKSLDTFTLVVRDDSGRVTFLEALPVNAVVNPLLEPEAIPTPTPTRPPNTNEFVPQLPSIQVPNFVGRGNEMAGTLFTFSFVPEDPDGTFTFQAIANFNAEIDKQTYPYVDFTDAVFGVDIPQIEIASGTAVVRQLARESSTIEITVRSDTWRDEVVDIIPVTSGLDNVRIEPRQITVPANQAETVVDIAVFTDNRPGTQGTLQLDFSSPDLTSQISDNTAEWTIAVESGLLVIGQQADTEILSGRGGDVVVKIDSDSPSNETVEISVLNQEGLEITDVVPSRLVVPAGEETQFTLKVYSDDEIGAAGSFTLLFETDADGVVVGNNQLTLEAEVDRGLSPLTLFSYFALFLAVAVAAFLIIRRRYS